MLELLERSSSPARVWKRADADPEELREYDAFGPWLLDVQSLRDMPRRFRPAYERLKDSAFLIKIPRNVDRRSVQPGQDLYGQCFALSNTGFTLLTADEDGDGYSMRESPWADIVAIRRQCNLLCATFSLLLRNHDIIEVDFNAVSMSLIDRVAAFARAHVTASGDGTEVFPAAAIPAKEMFFRSMLAEVQLEGRAAMPIHFEASGRRCRDEQNRRCVTNGLLLVVDGPELIVVDRDQAMRRRFLALYARRKTSFDMRAIDAFSLSPPSLEGGTGRLDLWIAGQPIGIPVIDTPQSFIDLLTRRGIAEVPPPPNAEAKRIGESS